MTGEEKSTRPGFLIAISRKGVISLDHLRGSLIGLGTSEIFAVDSESALIACGSYVT